MGGIIMHKTLRAMLFAGLVSFVATGSTSSNLPERLNMVQALPDGGNTTLSMMTYNIKGLPWPLAVDRDTALVRIGTRLRALRQRGHQPHILLLQEAFTPQAAEIARSSGYRHMTFGPDRQMRSPIAPSAADQAFLAEARWDRGEALGKQTDSGLIILSDYPILRVRRLAFPDFACAGFDCLANKGVVIADMQVPGEAEPVAIVNIHLNARKASGVSVSRSLAAYARQVDLSARFIASAVPHTRTLMIGGDMNIGGNSDRSRIFFDGFARHGLSFVAARQGGAQLALDQATIPAPQARADLKHAMQRRKDWIFARAGRGSSLVVRGAHVPFGSEPDGQPLSDHFGYVISYDRQRPQLAMADAPAASARDHR